MILDNEDQRTILLQALLNVPIQGDYAGLCEGLPKMQQVVEAVKAASTALTAVVEKEVPSGNSR